MSGACIFTAAWFAGWLAFEIRHDLWRWHEAPASASMIALSLLGLLA